MARKLKRIVLEESERYLIVLKSGGCSPRAETLDIYLRLQHFIMSKILEKPARKLFLIHVCRCHEVTDNPSPGSNSSSTSVKKWSTDCSGQTVTFSMVTVQGVVVEVMENGDSFLVDDGTAVCHVKGCSKIPVQATRIVKGHYVMVVGQLLKTGQCPLLRAVKVQNLSHNVSLATVWPLEVIDGLQQNPDIS